MKIFVEGTTDERLLKALEINTKNIEPSGNRAEVLKDLQKNTNVKGMIDQDPYSPQKPSDYEKSLTLTADQHDIALYNDRKRNNWLIVIKPRLEEWLIKIAKKAGIDMKNRGLSDDANKLHNMMTDETKKVASLVKELKNQEQADIKYLEQLCKEELNK